MDNVRVKIYPDCIRVTYSETNIYGKHKSKKSSNIKGLDDILVDQESAQRISVSRSKQKIFDYSACNKFDFFVTLTFNKQYVNRYDYDDCCKKMTNWLKNFKKRYCSTLSYLGVPERHKDGAFHFHFLMSGDLEQHLVDSGIRWKHRVVYNLPAYKFGWTTATRIYQNGNMLGGYMTKYITKDLCAATFNRKRYWHSSDLQLPKVIDDVLTYDDFHSLEDIVYEKKINTTFCNLTLAEFDKTDYNMTYIKSLIEREELKHESNCKHCHCQSLQAEGWKLCYNSPFV